MAVSRLDVLHVRTFPKEKDQGLRVIVDFESDSTTDRFVAFSSEGATICLGFERQHLSWAALAQLSELIDALARKQKK